MINDIKQINNTIEAPAAPDPAAANAAALVAATEVPPLSSLRVTTATVVLPEEPALRVDGVGFFALSDIHALKAKQKQGKTSVLKVCAAALLAGNQFRLQSALSGEPRVLYLDTEQKLTDVKLIVTDVAQMTGMAPERIDERLWVYALRRHSVDMLFADLCQLLADVQPRVVFIDGIVEFVASFNDESLAKQLVHDLLILAEANHCAIVCVLHTNKHDEDHNMRGHLGTILAQKAGTVLECSKLDGIIRVDCTDARHESMPSWSITYDGQGNICQADQQLLQAQAQRKEQQALQRQQRKQQKDQERLDCLLTIIRDYGGRIARTDLYLEMEKRAGVKSTTVKQMIRKEQGHALIESGGYISAKDDSAAPF